jgi:hypothetical protein
MGLSGPGSRCACSSTGDHIDGMAEVCERVVTAVDQLS